MGFVHPLLLTARMYPWQRQVDPSCKRRWEERLERERESSPLIWPALLALTMAKCVALLKSQPRGLCAGAVTAQALTPQHCHLLTRSENREKKMFLRVMFSCGVDGGSVSNTQYVSVCVCVVDY